MTCHNCKIECRKFGKTRKGQQRYRCCQLYKTYSEPSNEHLGGMYTAPEKVEAVITQLFEGCSIRSIHRITGVDQNTITKILAGWRRANSDLRFDANHARAIIAELKERGLHASQPMAA